MPTTLDYMKFSLNVYAASDKNLIGVPFGWIRSDWVPDLSDGFSAGRFIQGNEMVISYTGTNDFDDKINWGIGLGASSANKSSPWGSVPKLRLEMLNK